MEASQAFVSEGPDYVCVSCNRLLYRKTVQEFQVSKYDRIPSEFVVPESVRLQCKQWICTTCHYTLKRGVLPAQAKANHLDLDDIPLELSNLSQLEVRLISLRIPLVKMVALPCGAIHGPAVNVPTDLTPVCTLLPRLPSQTQMVPMKLKRKLSYKSHYMYQYIRPAKVLAALQWLKLNNLLYKNVEINSDWVSNAAEDDTKLWEALSAEHCPPPWTASESTNGKHCNMHGCDYLLQCAHVLYNHNKCFLSAEHCPLPQSTSTTVIISSQSTKLMVSIHLHMHHQCFSCSVEMSMPITYACLSCVKPFWIHLPKREVSWLGMCQEMATVSFQQWKYNWTVLVSNMVRQV